MQLQCQATWQTRRINVVNFVRIFRSLQLFRKWYLRNSSTNTKTNDTAHIFMRHYHMMLSADTTPQAGISLRQKVDLF